MEVTLAEALLVYGPLGLMAAIGVIFSVSMFRVIQGERKRQDKIVADQSAAHKAEMQAMVERYISTTTKQVEQYHNLADKINAVVASLSQRMRR